LIKDAETYNFYALNIMIPPFFSDILNL
jgi:hypothetical protein